MATDFNQVSQELAQDMELLRSSIQRSSAGLDQFGSVSQATVRKVQSFGQGLENATSTFVKSVYSSGSALEAMATTTQSAASSVANFAREFGVIGKIFGYIIEKLGFTVTQGVNDLDKAFKAYGDLSRQGATGAQGLAKFIEQAGKLNYNIDQLQDFGALLTKNSESLAVFGNGVLDSVDKIADLKAQFTRQGITGEFEAMGMRFHEINEGIVRYARILSITGRQDMMRSDQLVKGAAAYIKELDLMTKLTGKSAETLQNEAEARLQDERLLSAELRSKDEEQALRALDTKESIEAADRLKKAREDQDKILRAIPQDIARDLGALYEGLITDSKMASLMQIMPKTAEYIASGGRDFVETNRLMNEELKNSLGKDGLLNSVGATNSVLSAFGFNLKSLNDLMIISGRLAKGEELQKVLDGQIIKDPLTKAVAQLNVTFNLLQNSLQDLVRDGVEPIIKAFGENVKKLEKAGLTVPPYPFGPPPPPNVPPATPEQKKLQSAGGFSVNSSPTGLTKEPPVSPATNEPSAPGGPAPVKAPPPPPPPPAGASQTPPTDPLARFNFGGQRAERTGGGEASAKLIEMAGKVADLYPDLMITAFDDLFHRRRFPDSAHTKGRAMDFALIGDNRPRNIEESTAIKKMLQDMGLINVRDEYFADKDKNTTGPHFHAEVSARFGRLTSGPLSGYRATLHGNEVVIPLSNGTTIPLDMTPLIRNLDSNAQALAAQITRLDDLIMLSRDTLNVNRKMLSYRT